MANPKSPPGDYIVVLAAPTPVLVREAVRGAQMRTAQRQYASRKPKVTEYRVTDLHRQWASRAPPIAQRSANILK